MTISTSIILATTLLTGEPPFEVKQSPAGFLLRNAATPERHQIETMPGGVALFDYDGDGRLDLFFTNGAPQPSLVKPSAEWNNRLYRNLGNWRFEDATEKAGLKGDGYSMGAAAADYDNDGKPDLFVTGVNGNVLYRNLGDGTFADVTAKSGIAKSPWSIAAGWFDYDNDGYLDLFIVNYVKWDPKTEPFCGDRVAGYRTYCHPRYYEGLPNSLYRNNGDGTFTDVSKRSGIATLVGKGMGVAFADADGDGWMDVIVTNDTTPDYLFRNKGDGTFVEVGTSAGVAFNEDGLALSSMGVDFRDINNDGRPDAFVTALANETFPLYLNLGKWLFRDATYPSRIGVHTLPYSGWSTGIYDFDNDGWKDIFAANGDVNDNNETFSSIKSRQSCLLLINNTKDGFTSAVIGSPAFYRGASFGDIDGDGRVDVVVTRLNETPLLLRNTMGSGRNWLRIKLTGKKSNRDAIGARIKVTANGVEQHNHVTSSVGYASTSELTVHFGLGSAEFATAVEITWPNGAKQQFGEVRANQVLRLAEP